MDVHDLVRRCLKGDAAALDGFLAEFSDVIYQAVRATVWSADRSLAQELEDIFEEIVVGLLKDKCRALRAYDFKRDFKAWLYVVARGRCIDEVRRILRLRRTRPIQEEKEAELAAPAPAPAADPADPEEAARLRAAIEELPERQRVAVKMFFFDGRKYADIAQALGITVSEVASYLHRAKERLARALGTG
jgi:RNA polymerase sigma-70 factor (ECF subfamily)